MHGTENDMRADRIVKIEVEVEIAAPAERVFDAITVEMDAWFPHRFRPEGKMVFEPTVGGRCYEDWGGGAGAHHVMIVWWEPGKKFAATGPGVMYRGFDCYDVQTVVPNAAGDGCIYSKSTTFWGAVPDTMVKMIRDGARALMESHLKAYVLEGKRYIPPTSGS